MYPLIAFTKSVVSPPHSTIYRIPIRTAAETQLEDLFLINLVKIKQTLLVFWHLPATKCFWSTASAKQICQENRDFPIQTRLHIFIITFMTYFRMLLRWRAAENAEAVGMAAWHT